MHDTRINCICNMIHVIISDEAGIPASLQLGSAFFRLGTAISAQGRDGVALVAGRTAARAAPNKKPRDGNAGLEVSGALDARRLRHLSATRCAGRPRLQDDV
jgi:hypothetical protein